MRGRRPSPLDDGGETRVRVAAGRRESRPRAWEHMFVMHDLELRHRALDLVAAGVNDCEVGRRLGVARTTVRHWRWAKERDAPARALCWRCWQPTRRVAAEPPPTTRSCSGSTSAMATSRPCRAASACASRWTRNTRDRRRGRGAAEARVPGVPGRPGRRGRRIDGGALGLPPPPLVPVPAARPGQEAPAAPSSSSRGSTTSSRSAPWAFVRGCIRSDGCSFINRTGRYAYLSSSSATGRRTSSGSSPRPARSSACTPPVRRSRPALPAGGRRRAVAHVGVKS